MIEEIRIMSRTGANIFSGKINLDASEVEMADTDVLFAGFISAILSVSEELQNSDIRELGYQENKIIFTLTDNLIFLGFADTRVPNEDIQTLLDDIIRRWMVEYDDMEYPFVPDEMRSDVLKLIQDSIRDVFWWAAPSYSLTNNLKYIRTMFTKPGSSYFVQYLPFNFLLTGLLFFLATTGLIYAMGIGFTGFGGGVPIQNADMAFYASLSTLGLFVIGTTILMKAMFRGDFNISTQLTINFLYSVLFIGLIITVSEAYRFDFLAPIFNGVASNLLLTYGVNMFLFFAPLNIGFFGYIILSAYAGARNSNINTISFLSGYLIAVLVIISIAEFIATGVLAVVVA